MPCVIEKCSTCNVAIPLPAGMSALQAKGQSILIPPLVYTNFSDSKNKFLNKFLSQFDPSTLAQNLLKVFSLKFQKDEIQRLWKHFFREIKEQHYFRPVKSVDRRLHPEWYVTTDYTGFLGKLFASHADFSCVNINIITVHKNKHLSKTKFSCYKCSLDEKTNKVPEFKDGSFFLIPIVRNDLIREMGSTSHRLELAPVINFDELDTSMQGKPVYPAAEASMMEAPADKTQYNDSRFSFGTPVSPARFHETSQAMPDLNALFDSVKEGQSAKLWKSEWFFVTPMESLQAWDESEHENFFYLVKDGIQGVQLVHSKAHINSTNFRDIKKIIFFEKAGDECQRLLNDLYRLSESLRENASPSLLALEESVQRFLENSPQLNKTQRDALRKAFFNSSATQLLLSMANSTFVKTLSPEVSFNEQSILQGQQMSSTPMKTERIYSCPGCNHPIHYVSLFGYPITSDLTTLFDSVKEGQSAKLLVKDGKSEWFFATEIESLQAWNESEHKNFFYLVKDKTQGVQLLHSMACVNRIERSNIERIFFFEEPVDECKRLLSERYKLSESLRENVSPSLLAIEDSLQRFLDLKITLPDSSFTQFLSILERTQRACNVLTQLSVEQRYNEIFNDVTGIVFGSHSPNVSTGEQTRSSHDTRQSYSTIYNNVTKIIFGARSPDISFDEASIRPDMASTPFKRGDSHFTSTHSCPVCTKAIEYRQVFGHQLDPHLNILFDSVQAGQHARLLVKGAESEWFFVEELDLWKPLVQSLAKYYFYLIQDQQGAIRLVDSKECLEKSTNVARVFLFEEPVYECKRMLNEIHKLAPGFEGTNTSLLEINDSVQRFFDNSQPLDQTQRDALKKALFNSSASKILSSIELNSTLNSSRISEGEIKSNSSLNESMLRALNLSVGEIPVEDLFNATLSEVVVSVLEATQKGNVSVLSSISSLSSRDLETSFNHTIYGSPLYANSHNASFVSRRSYEQIIHESPKRAGSPNASFASQPSLQEVSWLNAIAGLLDDTLRSLADHNTSFHKVTLSSPMPHSAVRTQSSPSLGSPMNISKVSYVSTNLQEVDKTASSVKEMNDVLFQDHEVALVSIKADNDQVTTFLIDPDVEQLREGSHEKSLLSGVKQRSEIGQFYESPNVSIISRRKDQPQNVFIVPLSEFFNANPQANKSTHDISLAIKWNPESPRIAEIVHNMTQNVTRTPPGSVRQSLIASTSRSATQQLNRSPTNSFIGQSTPMNVHSVLFDGDLSAIPFNLPDATGSSGRGSSGFHSSLSENAPLPMKGNFGQQMIQEIKTVSDRLKQAIPGEFRFLKLQNPQAALQDMPMMLSHMQRSKPQKRIKELAVVVSSSQVAQPISKISTALEISQTLFKASESPQNYLPLVRVSTPEGETTTYFISKSINWFEWLTWAQRFPAQVKNFSGENTRVMVRSKHNPQAIDIVKPQELLVALPQLEYEYQLAIKWHSEQHALVPDITSDLNDSISELVEDVVKIINPNFYAGSPEVSRANVSSGSLHSLEESFNRSIDTTGATLDPALWELAAGSASTPQANRSSSPLPANTSLKLIPNPVQVEFPNSVTPVGSPVRPVLTKRSPPRGKNIRPENHAGIEMDSLEVSGKRSTPAERKSLLRNEDYSFWSLHPDDKPWYQKRKYQVLIGLGILATVAIGGGVGIACATGALAACRRRPSTTTTTTAIPPYTTVSTYPVSSSSSSSSSSSRSSTTTMTLVTYNPSTAYPITTTAEPFSTLGPTLPSTTTTTSTTTSSTTITTTFTQPPPSEVRNRPLESGLHNTWATLRRYRRVEKNPSVRSTLSTFMVGEDYYWDGLSSKPFYGPFMPQEWEAFLSGLNELCGNECDNHKMQIIRILNHLDKGIIDKDCPWSWIFMKDIKPVSDTMGSPHSLAALIENLIKKGAILYQV